MEILGRNWWAIGLRGIFAIVFGLIALIWPGIALGALIILFGAYAFLDGIFALVAAVRAAERHRAWWALALEGVFGIVIGIGAWVWPGLTALALLYLIAAWALLTGIAELVAAYRLHEAGNHGWVLAVAGVLSVIFGLYLFVFPGAGALSVIWIIGVYAIVFGITLLGLAWRLHERHTAL
jgi:uncharacterized membrane protein HdeD (DUF308 family)